MLRSTGWGMLHVVLNSCGSLRQRSDRAQLSCFKNTIPVISIPESQRESVGTRAMVSQQRPLGGSGTGGLT